MVFDLGIEEDHIASIFLKFQNDKKIYYFEGWVLIKNFIKNQWYTTPTIRKGIETVISQLPPKIMAYIKETGYILYISPDRIPISPDILSVSESKSKSKSEHLPQKEDKKEIQLRRGGERKSDWISTQQLIQQKYGTDKR